MINNFVQKVFFCICNHAHVTESDHFRFEPEVLLKRLREKIRIAKISHLIGAMFRELIVYKL